MSMIESASPQQPSPGQGHVAKHRRSNAVSRRRILFGGLAAAAAGGLGLAGMASAGGTRERVAPGGPAGVACTLTAEAPRGPYALPGALVRTDIREGRPGVPVQYLFTVVDASNGCAPLPGALVELWQSDHRGEYSGFVGSNGHDGDDNGTFLRGGGITDENGQVEIVSSWPGRYAARAVHAHLRVHTGVTLTGDSYTGGKVVHTGQLFFDPAINTEVQATHPYVENVTRETPLDADSVYDGGGAASGLLTLNPLGGRAADGYAATLTVGVAA